MNATCKTVVGVDTAKSVFQVYTVEQSTGEVINKPIKRAQFLQWFANRPPWSDRHGGMRRFAALGAQASGIGARGKADEREDGQGFRQR
jgi:hypothetical protein